MVEALTQNTCKHCGKHFGRPSYARRHEQELCTKRPHPEVVHGYQCKSKDHLFACVDKLSFYDHFRNKHQNFFYTCENCSQQFTNFSTAIKHSKKITKKTCENPTQFKRPPQSEIDNVVSAEARPKSWEKKKKN